MLAEAIEKYQAYLNGETPETTSADGSKKKNLFAGEARIVSLQVCLHKIPNLMNEKQIVCPLPHSLHPAGHTQPELCLIVKDLDRKDRDYEKTVRKNQQLIEKCKLTSTIAQIVPLKQINLEFRPFEAKRKLSTSFDMFIADKCLTDILRNGSKLGKEFAKRRKMPIFVDMSKEPEEVSATIRGFIDSTIIRLNGKGATLDVNAFLSTHTTSEAMANIEAVRAELIKLLPGGEANIKAMFLKSTNAAAVPIYVDASGTSVNDIKLPNNMTPRLLKKSKKRIERQVKRLGTGKAAKKAGKKVNRKLDKTINKHKKTKTPVVVK